jgi:hypothetical protein
MSWEIKWAPEAAAWFEALKPSQQRRIEETLEPLGRLGPQLKRPLADHVKGSRHQNMKELRPTASTRLLFAFDPDRRAIILLGGDKRGNWKGWYRANVKEADNRLDRHLQQIGKGGTWQALRTGMRSAGRSR